MIKIILQLATLGYNGVDAIASTQGKVPYCTAAALDLELPWSLAELLFAHLHTVHLAAYYPCCQMYLLAKSCMPLPYAVMLALSSCICPVVGS